jgi:hypothetical protein
MNIINTKNNKNNKNINNNKNNVKNNKKSNTQLHKSINNLSTSSKKALLIAINYENTQYQLNGCTNDIMLIKSILDKRGFSSSIISEKSEKSEKKPTKDNIIKELSSFLSQSKDNDILYIHYSGHGSNIIDKNNDESDLKDETIVTSDLLNITDDELNIIIKDNLKSKAKLFAVFDSCHSGSILDLNYILKDKENKIYLESSQSSQSSFPPNVVLISGCRDEQYSQEVTTSNGSNGLLTTSLYNNLCFSINNNISWIQLFSNIKNLLKNIQAEQVPQLSCSSIINLNDRIFL